MKPDTTDATTSAPELWSGLEEYMGSEAFKQDLAANYWSADFMGPRDAAEFMQQKYQSFRRALLDIGMVK